MGDWVENAVEPLGVSEDFGSDPDRPGHGLLNITFVRSTNRPEAAELGTPVRA